MSRGGKAGPEALAHPGPPAPDRLFPPPPRPPADQDGVLFDRDLLSRAFQRLIHDVSHAAAAGNLHVQDGDRADRVLREYLCEFRDVALDVRIQFRAEEDHDLIPQVTIQPKPKDLFIMTSK